MVHTLEHGGCKLTYDVRGHGRPVLFIQGVGVHGAGWAPQVEALADDHQCLSFDNRGIGASQPAGAGLSVQQMADDALALLAAWGWGSAHVVGHSLGGLVALQLALAARSRVRSLSLLCTFARGRSAAPLSLRMMGLGLGSRLGPRWSRRRAFLRLILPPSVSLGRGAPELAERLAVRFGHDLADQPRITGAQLDAMRAYDATPRLRQLAGIPTLVVSAEHDLIAPPRLGRALAAGIPGAEYREIAGSAHGLPIDRAAVVNTLLRQHFSRVEQPARIARCG